MDLVTVTCLRDKQQMLLQAQSIERFLEPCTHWVIVNDKTIDKENWITSLTPFYSNHNLKILFPKWNMFPRGTGYQKQQCYKLWISQLINSNYLILDSKNFFIKPSSINDWEGIIGSGILIDFSDVDNIWLPTFQRYKHRINFQSNPKYQLGIETPFVIKKEIINCIENFDEFLIWFNDQNVLHSEFLYYSMIAEKHGFLNQKLFTTKKLHRAFFPNKKPNIKHQLEHIDTLNEVKIISFHRNYIKKLHSNDISFINKWLENKELNVCKINTSI
jgi:hypothetical protein